MVHLNGLKADIHALRRQHRQVGQGPGARSYVPGDTPCRQRGLYRGSCSWCILSKTPLLCPQARSHRRALTSGLPVQRVQVGGTQSIW